MERRYTVGAARAALGGIDAKTFLRWCAKAGIELRTNPRNEREKLITPDDLARLAEWHERTLSPLPDGVPNTLQAALGIIARQEAEIRTLRQQVDILKTRQTAQEPRYAAHLDETMQDTTLPRPRRPSAAVTRRSYAGNASPFSGDVAKRQAATLAVDHGGNSWHAAMDWRWDDETHREGAALATRATAIAFIRDYLAGHPRAGRWHTCQADDCPCQSDGGTGDA